MCWYKARISKLIFVILAISDVIENLIQGSKSWLIMLHLSAVTWVSWHLRSQSTLLSIQELSQANNKENIKCPLHGEFTADWWIPLTKGQWCRTLIHVMTPSWSGYYITHSHHKCFKQIIYNTQCVLCRHHSGYGLSQWERMLHSIIMSHWLSPYLDWSL